MLRLATGPVTWGVDFADAPDNPPWQQVLDEIASSPLDALELGPVGYLPEEPGPLREALESRSLEAVGSFVFEDLHDPVSRDAVLAIARRACKAIEAAGGHVLVIIDRPSTERAATAGRSEVAPRLSRARWEEMVTTIVGIAAIARDAGLRPAIHPHAGGYIEFEDEIEALAEGTDFDFCLDTGHLAYAGIDPVRALRAYGSRLAHIHLKDVDRGTLDRVRASGTDFWTAIKEEVFCPLGDGVVDLVAVFRTLELVDYDGFATIEQDRVPGAGSALDDLSASLRVLGAIAGEEIR